MTHRLAQIRAGRHPHEVLVAVTSLVVGGGGLLGGNPSSAVQSALDPRWQTVYYAMLILGGLVTLFGIARPKGIINGLYVERVGLATLALMFAAYTLVIFIDRGTAGAMFAAIPFSYTVCTAARARQIGRELPLLRSYLQDMPGGEQRGERRDVG